MRLAVSSRGRYWIARAGRPNSAGVWKKGPSMQLEFWRCVCAALLCATLASCVSSGGTHVGENKADKLEDAARVRVELGQRYMEQGKLELALENLQKALEYDANYVDAHTVIAVLYARLGKDKDAGEHYARAAELAPKSGAANNNYGQFLCASGRLAEAQKYFARAMDDP